MISKIGNDCEYRLAEEKQEFLSIGGGVPSHQYMRSKQ